MLKEEIHLWDLNRILFGEVPASFAIELVIRLVVVYFILLFSMRLMGARIAAQMNGVELAAVVSLAAATGMAIASPDRGLLPAAIIAAVVVIIQQLLVNIATHNQNFEQKTLGDINILIDESAMRLNEMKKSRISRERLFAQLRSSGIKHLGEVKRLYFEISGEFTVIKRPEPIPGLSVIPACDPKLKAEIGNTSNVEVCCRCGKKKPEEKSSGRCDKCGSTEFERAIA